MNNLVELLPYPAPDANKYSRGKLIVVAGSARYPGAAALASAACARMGAGYTQVFTHGDNVTLVQGFLPSLVVDTWDAFAQMTSENTLAPSSSTKPCACVVGSGFDASDASALSVLLAALKMACPVVVDGGALSFCGDEDVRSRLDERASAGLTTVLTPHGGEAARLAKAAGLDLDINANPAAAAQALSQTYQACVVLKGSVTYVAFQDEVRVMDEGTSALAKAGTGDVLAGMMGSLFAQRAELTNPSVVCDVAYLATLLHALAGKIAAEQKTTISVLAEDVIQAIPQAIQAYEQVKTI